MTSAELRRTPSARTIARLMTMKRDHLTKAKTLTVAAIEEGAPALAETRNLVDRFQSIVQRSAVDDLDPSAPSGRTQPDRIFRPRHHQGSCRRARCRHRPWSNGQTEGHVNRLKLLKHQMYGRAKLDLLQARLVGTP